MNKKIQHKESRGLPGGPNEMFTYTTGIFSTEGFRMDSPDVNNYENIIPSGSITMKERDGSPLKKGPIYGVDNLGNEQVMYPGYDYEFPGTEVTETLLAKMGGGLLDKTIKCSSCGWEWKAADGGSDIMSCHKCPGKGVVKAQNGGEDLMTEYAKKVAKKFGQIGNKLMPVSFVNKAADMAEAKGFGFGEDNQGPLDAVRHASAATSVASNLPVPSFMNNILPGSEQAIREYGSRALGALYEIANYNSEGRDMDFYNNKIGAQIGSIPGLTDEQRLKLINNALVNKQLQIDNNKRIKPKQKGGEKLSINNVNLKPDLNKAVSKSSTLEKVTYKPDNVIPLFMDRPFTTVNQRSEENAKDWIDHITGIADINYPKYNSFLTAAGMTTKGGTIKRNKTRASYSPLTNSVNLPTGEEETYKYDKVFDSGVAEAAHVRQYRDTPILDLLKQKLKAGLPSFNENEYNTEGTIEHTAHSVIQPMIEDELNNKLDNYSMLDRIKNANLPFTKFVNVNNLKNYDDKISAIENYNFYHKKQEGGEQEDTPWTAYLNPANWGTSRYDDAGTFKKAFRAARVEGDSDFLYKGNRYSTELKPAAAPMKGITPELLIRQAYRESTFNPNAVSPAGFKGLGQIGKAVIKDYKKANNITGEIDPFNMKQNTDVQKYSMNELYNSSFIDKPNQSEQVRLAKTLASYNWGRDNVLNLLNDLKEDGVDIYNSLDWVSKLPSEPRKYINDILLQKNTTFNTDFSKALSDQKNIPIKRLYGFRDGGESKPGPLMKAYNRLPIEKKMGGTIVNKKQFGGQLNSGNITMYKDYIKGDVENETEAVKNYDKLNRIYYSKAKELGMSAANYIMTYVVGNS